MKKYILALIFSVFTLCGFAQDHLSFKGIPITGSMTSFCQSLREKGFSQAGKDGNITLFTGNFTGRKAKVGVVSTDNGKDVFRVVVLFDESDSWNTLVNTYNYYKALYVEKYGEPSVCIENNPSRRESNTALMGELYSETVTYTSVFETTGGTIQISIEKSTEFYQGWVVIRYEDTQNTEAKHKSDLEEI